MKNLSIQFGIIGSTLGILAGLIELSIGAQIRPWIGNKENPAVLGLVTILLSGMALAAFIVATQKLAPTDQADAGASVKPSLVAFFFNRAISRSRSRWL